MKRALTTRAAAAACIVLCLVFSFSAVNAASLDGDYSVIMYCNGSAGDFCNEGVVTEIFTFDDGELGIAHFEDDYWDYVNNGEYDDRGFTFTAEYQAYSSDLGVYHITAWGVHLSGEVIAGTLTIKYSTIADNIGDIGDVIDDLIDDLIGDDDDDENKTQEEETRAYFAGIRM